MECELPKERQQYYVDQLQYLIGSDPQTCRSLLMRTHWDVYQAKRLYASGSQIVYRKLPRAPAVHAFEDVTRDKRGGGAFATGSDGQTCFDGGTVLSNRCLEVYDQLCQLPSAAASSSSASASSLTGVIALYKNGLVWGDHVFFSFVKDAAVVQHIIDQLRNARTPAVFNVPPGALIQLKVSKHPARDYLPRQQHDGPLRRCTSLPISSRACVSAVCSPSADDDHLAAVVIGGSQPCPDAVSLIVVLLSGARIRVVMSPHDTLAQLKYLLAPFAPRPFHLHRAYPPVSLESDLTVAVAGLQRTILRLKVAP